MGFFRSLAAATGNVVSSITGAKVSENNTKSTNKANMAINKSQLDFTAQQNEIMREREDTAYQRKAADLEAAGINPLMASASGGGSIASAGQSAPSMIGMQTNRVGEIISGAGGAITSDMLNMANIKKSEAEAEKAMSEADFNRLTMADQATLIKSQIDQVEFKNAETKAQTESILLNMDATKTNMLLQKAQTALATANTEESIKNAIKTAVFTDLLYQQIDKTKAEIQTEGYKQSELAGRANNLLQEAKVNKAMAEKLSKEIEEVAQQLKLNEINLKYLPAEKVMNLVGEGSQSLRDILMGLGIGANAYDKVVPKNTNKIGF